MVTFLEVPPSLMSSSSAPSVVVYADNADTLVVAIVYSVIMYVGDASIEASITR